MNYDEWLDEVDNLTWVRLGAQLNEFEDVDFGDLYEQGLSPEAVVQLLYEEADEEEEEDEPFDDDF